jgi:uncharacterized membrane protein YphA (DoxX/SURF4 family)
LLAALFLAASAGKLLGSAVEQFAHWGYPAWFSYAVGVWELACAVLLLIPRTALLGAGGILAVMAGAAFTHLRAGEFSRLPIVLVVIALAAAVGWARRGRVTVAPGTAG